MIAGFRLAQSLLCSIELSILAQLPECWGYRASLISNHLKILIKDVMAGFDAPFLITSIYIFIGNLYFLGSL